jgi:hypothetical protein
MYGKLKSLLGRTLGVDVDGSVIARNGFGTGNDGTPSVTYNSHDWVAIFDDFLGDAIEDQWALNTGDTGQAATAHIALITGTGGVVRIAPESAPAPVHTQNHCLTQGLFKNWKAKAAPNGRDGILRMTARYKQESVSRTVERQHIFIGFSDSGGAETPVYDTGVGPLANATDAVGFLIAPGADTGFNGVSVLNGTVKQSVLGVSPTANKYHTLSLEVRTSQGDAGVARFWVDGVLRGKIDAPVTQTVAMSPWLGQWVQDTGILNLDIDYINIASTRDTGM